MHGTTKIKFTEPRTNIKAHRGGPALTALKYIKLCS